MKRILFLADINSAHTEKWITTLVEKGFNVGVFSLSKSTTHWYQQLPNFELFDKHGFDNETFNKKAFKKIAFLKVLPALKNVIENFRPIIVHAHYASSYGLIGALCNFHPFIISVWGSDVFDFPKHNLINKNILKFNLSKADLILSTSEAMQRETQLYTDKTVGLTPFGIDLGTFKPMTSVYNNENEIVIGTIKTMEDIYGISYLIKAFQLLTLKHSQLNLKLLLVGGGLQIDNYKKLVNELELTSKVQFTGRIKYADVVQFHNQLDVFVAVSTRESFGVAVLEASACEKPVVVSNVGGLPEVVMADVTGFIVPPANVQATADAIEKLLLDKSKRITFGRNGRRFVREKYDWSNNVNTIIAAYESVL